VVLAEDQCQQIFVRRYLYLLGYEKHDIHPEPISLRRGSGEQWVRQRYANAVAAYRRRSSRAQTTLIAIIDADSGDVQRRQRQFDQALRDAGLLPRSADERIVHLIPKWSIESWILCLNGRTVDENASYRNEADIDPQIAPAAGVLFEWTRPNSEVPEHCAPSLRLATEELHRIG
jgi:hypothetical protein